MKPGFCKLKVRAGLGNTMNWYGIFNQLDQPSQFGYIDPHYQQCG
jgi:hypothetical protein